MNVAILLSGGIGTRLKSDVPKQYIRVNHKMIITYSLETLVNSPAIDEIQIVAEEEWREFIVVDAKKHGIPTEKIKGFALPGYNRQASILNGMQNILRQKNGIVDVENADVENTDVRNADVGNTDEQDNILIHDAARPLLTQKLLQDCFAMLSGHDGVMPALPMKDTVYLSRNGSVISELVERKQLYAGQAPEVFNFRKYYLANMNLMPDRLTFINGSTEPAIMAGMDIAMIPGEEKNFKITTQEDLYRFQTLIEEGSI